MHCNLRQPDQWWKYKFRGPGTVKMTGAPPCFGLGASSNCSRFKSHVKNIIAKRLYSNIRILHAVQTDKTLWPLYRKPFSSFFSFAFNSLKNVYWHQHYPATSFNLHFCPGIYSSFLQYSVPRSAFKGFCIIRVGHLSALDVSRIKGPKIETKDWKRFEVLEEGAASPLPIS